MECQVQLGEVVNVKEHEKRQEITVEINGRTAKAISFPDLTGSCVIGDRVILNTTAVSLGLGTGGAHFVMGIYGKHRDLTGSGHIMKLRYTPVQGRVLSVEEPSSPHHQQLQQAKSLDALPVIVGAVHSMLAPIALAFHQKTSGKRLVYLMSDGAALPIGLSRLVESLQASGLVQSTVTFGHAFGGDYEAINVYSALLAAHVVCKADVAVVIMGPGVVGTNTQWGTSALEQGTYINAVNTLEGIPIAALRMSLAEKRPRHQGISHHAMTSLTQITNCRTHIPLPRYAVSQQEIESQLKHLQHHFVYTRETDDLFAYLLASDISVTTMGRGPNDDPYFFHSALAAGALAADFVNGDTSPQQSHDV